VLNSVTLNTDNMSVLLEEWIAKQHRLIDLEKREETAQLQDKMSTLSAKQCQSSGLSLLHLEVDAVRSALFGRCCVSLHKLGKGTIEQCFKVGDEVSLYNPKLASISNSDGDQNVLFGLVSKMSHNTIEIIVDEFDEHRFDPPLRMDLRSSQKTHSTMQQALNALLHEGRDHSLVRLLFFPEDVQHLDLLAPSRALTRISTVDGIPALSSSRSCPESISDEWNPVSGPVWNSALNSSQQAAIDCALASTSVSIIHGPVRVLHLCLHSEVVSASR
jgi:hypothetical protein